ncbi:ABC transporter permease [Fibrobacterales bacterium]|nr:ABC transporter permease [Fibrobacterales bacterium]
MNNPILIILLGPWLVIGRFLLTKVLRLFDIILLFWDICIRLPKIRHNTNITMKQMVQIGVTSIPLLFVTSIFTGMVAAIQAKYQFRGFVPDKFVGTAAAKMIFIELGPVLTGLVMAGRVGSALAAEIGSMKEKEELDAMVVLDLDPLRYLAAPRMFAFMTMMPALTVFSMFLAVLGAWFVCVMGLDMTSFTFLTGIKYFFNPLDVFAGLLKAFVFGISICLMGYYNGINAGSGAKGVGRATMNVVVSSSVLILFFDFLIALILF